MSLTVSNDIKNLHLTVSLGVKQLNLTVTHEVRNYNVTNSLEVVSVEIKPTLVTQGLQGEKGEDGVDGDGDLNFTFTQPTPSLVWTMPHGLGKYPNVVIRDSAGTIWTPTLSYPDINTTVATFAIAIAGTAQLN